MPNSFAVDPSGLLLVASGMDPVVRWDGLTTQAELAGVTPPDTAPTVAGDGTVGTITGTYAAYVRFIDNRGNFSNLSPISTPLVLSKAGGVVYTNVPRSGEFKVVARQILRNTAGQAQTFYVDVDTEDLTATTFSSKLTDPILSVQQAVPLVGPNAEDLAERYGVPPDFCSYLIWHQNRMFMAGVFPYSEGNARVTQGSDQVQGIGTEWGIALIGRLFYADGSRNTPLVTAVDRLTQTLTLSAPYDGVSSGYAVYSIRPAPGFTRLLYFSEPGLSEAWPPTNALQIPETGDQMTGLASLKSYLFVLERNHIWAISFQDDPGTDGGCFQRAQRGCVNDRCWVVVGTTAYLMDEAGIYTFDGDAEGQTISQAVQGIFRGEDSRYRIRWASRRYFHAAHFPTEDTIRWFVCLSGSYLPRHALCYQYTLQRWWVEEFPFPIACNCLGRAGSPAADWQELVRQVYLGSAAGRVMTYPWGYADGPDPRGSDLAGGILSADRLGFTADRPLGPDLVGGPVDVIRGRGKGQRRVAASASGTLLRVVQPWTVVPDATSRYRAGGVRFRWQSGWFRYMDEEAEQQVRLEATFRRTSAAAQADLFVFTDRSAVPDPWAVRRDADEGYAVSAVPGSPALTVELSDPAGQAFQQLSRRKDRDTVGNTYLSVAVSGVAPAEPTAFFVFTLDGVE